ncbi:MAG: hypothetical protein QNJ33_02520 [Crocosphaera sp.]|nr:hypothetical protein [Crocosphaera sp.]
MTDYPTISKENPKFPPYLDFQVLRRLGIEYIQGLSSQLWTDYNLHDPGVTILEVLCYAVTDLGYRIQLDITDLLTLDPQDSQKKETNFFTPDEILTCNPVTGMDWRKRLIDIPGVRNAWLEKKLDYQPTVYADRPRGQLQYTLPNNQTEETALKLKPKGLYRVCLDLDPLPYQDACGQIIYSWEKTLKAVKAVLCQYRNLCEDFDEIIVLGQEEIALCGDIELEPNADPEDVQVAIYVAVQEFLAPRLQFYSLQDLLAQGKSLPEIFAGRPSALYDSSTCYNSHGFINPDELKALEIPEYLHTSDLYQIIMDVPGVRAIKKLSISNYINGLPQSQGNPWCLQLTDKHRPILGVSQSKITFFKGDLPFNAKTDEVQQRYYEQQRAYIKALRESYELNLPIPRGRYLDLGDHYSIHHDFPLTYGIGDEGLSNTELPLRKAKAKQLKGYLIFFDQMLANYLAQLANIRQLFSYDNPQESPQQTYFSQTLTNVPGVDEIILNYYSCPGSDRPTGDLNESSNFIDYPQWLETIREDPTTYVDRRHRFLDHLLARFAESFTDYVVLNYRMDGGRRDNSDIIADKTSFLQDYPTLSRDRFRAFDYCACHAPTNPLDQKNNVSGFQKRVSRLLGMDYGRRSLNPYHVSLFPENTFKISLLSLTKIAIYDKEAAAEEALDSFLSAALEPSHYRRLSYYPYYQYQDSDSGNPQKVTKYGYVLVDSMGTLLAESPARFSTVRERDQALKAWISGLQANNNRVEVKPSQGCFFFELLHRTGNPVLLQATNRVHSKEEAEEQIKRVLNEGKNRNNYRLIDETEFTFVLHLEVETPFATHPQQYCSAIERNLHLDALLYYLNHPTPISRIEGEIGTYRAILLDRQENPLLITYQTYSTQHESEEAYQTLLHLARDDVYFQPIDDLPGDLCYGFTLLDRHQNTIATHPHSYRTACHRDLVIRHIINYVNQDIESSLDHRESGIYYQLMDQSHHFLLVGVIPYADEPTAYQALEAMLILGSERDNYQLLDDELGDCPYGFALYDGTTLLATHPDVYATPEERDRALQTVIDGIIGDDPLYRIEGNPGRFTYTLLDPLAAEENPPDLLQGVLIYGDEDQAKKAFEELLSFAVRSDRYRRLDHLSTPNCYGFELLDDTDTIIAQPLNTYSSEGEREAAIDKIITYIVQSEVLYRILNPEGSFYPEIWEQGGHALWIIRPSCAHEPSTESDRRDIEILAHQIKNYVRIETEIEDYPYGFQLKDETETIIADYPCLYATEKERNDQITYLWRNYGTGGDRLWIGTETFRDQGAATREGERISRLAAQRERYGMNQEIGSHSQPIRTVLLFSFIVLIDSRLYRLSLVFFENYFYSYSLTLTDETGQVIANHPKRYGTQAEAYRQMERLWRQFRGLNTFVETPEIAPSQFIFKLPAELFNLFQEPQQGGLTGAIFSSPNQKKDQNGPETFSSDTAAREAFLKRLPLILNEDNIVRNYDNRNCQFCFQLIDSRHPNQPIMAESCPVYQSRAQMEGVIAFLQAIARGWSLTYASPGTCCGYYFFVHLPHGTDHPLKSLTNYPNEEQAWKAAGSFAEHLRYRRRYINPAVDINGQCYPLGITDGMGNLLAVSRVEADLDEIFRSLNAISPSLLAIEPRFAEDGEEMLGYGFKLKDRAENTLLEGTEVQPDEATSETHFYRDVLSILLEPWAIERITDQRGLCYSYRVVSLPTDPYEPPLVLATHPQNYASDIELEEAIEHLQLLVRTSRLTTDIQQQEPAYMGSIVEDEHTVLLQGITPHKTKKNAWDEGNMLLELAGETSADPSEIGENFRLIEDEEGQNLYSWELVNEGKDRILGKPPHPFSTPEERKEAIDRLQASINNEGFHLIEHILLRPKHPPPLPPYKRESYWFGFFTLVVVRGPQTFALSLVWVILLPEKDEFLPIPKTPETSPKAFFCSANYDPYSFRISVVLPYWPNRFRDRNFRRFVERTLRLEAPAHIGLKICWINVYQMQTFETAYWEWLEQLHLEACENQACGRTKSLNRLLEVLSNLTNIYPEGTLHDCQESDENDNPIILNQTALGTANNSND